MRPKVSDDERPKSDTMMEYDLTSQVALDGLETSEIIFDNYEAFRI